MKKKKLKLYKVTVTYENEEELEVPAYTVKEAREIALEQLYVEGYNFITSVEEV